MALHWSPYRIILFWKSFLSLSLSLSISSESEACVFIINADYGFDKNNSTQVFLIHNQYFYFNSTWSPSLSLSLSLFTIELI